MMGVGKVNRGIDYFGKKKFRGNEEVVIRETMGIGLINGFGCVDNDWKNEGGVEENA